MQQVVCLLALIVVLTGCKKEQAPSSPSIAMSAVVNGHPWEARAATPVAVAQIDRAPTGSTSQHTVTIRGGSDTFSALGLKTLDITLSANYLPKVGRHPINYGSSGYIGIPNPYARQLQAVVAFQLPNSQTYQAQAVSGFLDIAEVTSTQVVGTFELTASTIQPSNGAPAVMQVQDGKFCARIIGTTNTNVSWSEGQ